MPHLAIPSRYRAPRWPYRINWHDPLSQGLVYATMLTPECAPDMYDPTGQDQILTYSDAGGSVDPLRSTLPIEPGLTPYVQTDTLAYEGDNFYSTDTSYPVVSAMTSNNFTVSCWSIRTIDTNVRAGVFGNRAVQVTMQVQWATTTGVLMYQGTGSQYVWSGTAGILGVAHEVQHLVRTFNSAGATNTDKVQLWINGENRSSELTYAGTPVAGTNAAFVMFNGQYTAATTGSWHGALWDFRVYDRTLEPDEIRALYLDSSRWSVWEELPSRVYFVPGAPPPVGGPKGPLGHPLHGPLAGPIGP